MISGTCLVCRDVDVDHVYALSCKAACDRRRTAEVAGRSLKAICSLKGLCHKEIVFGESTRDFPVVHILVKVTEENDLIARSFPTVDQLSPKRIAVEVSQIGRVSEIGAHVAPKQFYGLCRTKGEPIWVA